MDMVDFKWIRDAAKARTLSYGITNALHTSTRRWEEGADEAKMPKRA